MAGKVSVPIAVAIQGVTKTQQQLRTLGSGLSSLGKTAGLAAVGFAAFTAGVKGTDFAVQAIAGARDLERNLAGLKTVFEDVTPQMVQFSKGAVNMGLSMNEAAKASTFIGSVLKQSGFDINETANLTERLTGLATDLSITYGYDVQEALLGMTALFRGEYDPIEKFGVAMKQSEINAELAARKMDHLTGAQRRFAEQQIRVELLFQRSSDAVGAMERQSGTLAVEQIKLAATFNNVKDTVASSLLPVITQLMIDLQGVMTSVGPELKQVFDDLAPVIENAANVLVPVLVDAFFMFVDVIKEIINLVGDIFNPLSDLGESFTALGIQVASVFETITGNELSVTSVFDIIETVIRVVVDAVHDLLYIIENTIIGFKVMGEMVSALLNGDWEKLFTTDWSAQITGQIALKDAFNANQLAVAKFNQEIANTKNVLAKANTAWSNSWIARGEWWAKNNPAPSVAETILDTGTGAGSGSGSTKTKKAVKNYVADLVANIKEEVQKQTARLQLEKMTGSKGLIDSILGSEGWMKIWLQIKSGNLSLADLEKQFFKTAAGAEELSKAAEDARKAWEVYDAAIKAINDDLAAELISIAEKYDAVRLSFQDMIDAFAVLPTVSRQLGQFESSAVTYLSSIEESLKSAFRNGDIFEAAYNELKAYARQELSALAAIEKQRDDMANRYSLADALIKEYRSAFTSALSLTNLFSKLSTDTQTRTVTEVSQGVVKLGSDLRTFNVTVSKSYEETLDSVADKSAGLLDGFKQMAIKARAFAENLKQLKALGLDPMLFDQLVQAGVEAGGETAQALIDGGSDTINELNSIFSEIDSLGADLGEQVAMTLYGTGVDMADGLMAGIASKQSELETQARALAEAFNTAFSSKITTAVGQVQSAAESTARSNADNAIAAVEVPTVPRPETMIDQAALKQLDALIAKAGSYASNIGDATKAAGALVKSDIYQQLRDTVAAGGVVNLSGIQSGLSSAELANRAATAAAGSGTTININVKTDATQSTAMVGKQLGSIVTSYVQTGGQVLVN